MNRPALFSHAWRYAGWLLFSGCLASWSAAADFQRLNTENLNGWTIASDAGKRHWRAKDGQLIGENPDKQGSIIWTDKAYRNFELELEYKTPSPDYDSGVFIRGKSHQVQIGVSRSLQIDLTGCIYAPKDNQGSYPARTDKVEAYHKLGKWNHLRVVARNKQIETYLNGEPFVDYQAVTIPDVGPIGLQLHGNVHMKMIFRNLRVRPL